MWRTPLWRTPLWRRSPLPRGRKNAHMRKHHRRHLEGARRWQRREVDERDAETSFDAKKHGFGINKKKAFERPSP